MAALPYQWVLVKLKSEQPFERTAEKKKSHKKRPTTASENETTAAVKRQRVVKQEVKQDLLDEPQGDIRHASDRQSSDELNRYEAGQVVGIGHRRRGQGSNLPSTGPAILIFGSISKSSQQLLVGHVIDIGCQSMMAAIVSSTTTATEPTALGPATVVAGWSS